MSAQPDADVGQRLEALRRRGGLSRDRLARLAGCSPSLVKAIERGERGLTLRTAQRLGAVLGVRDLSEMYGPNVRLSLDGRPSHPAVPEVRAALTAWPVTVGGAPATPDYLRGAVDATWRTWHMSRQQRSEVGAMLPGLIDTAQRAVRLSTGDERRANLAQLAEVMHIGQAFLAWHGDRELVWLTVDRGMTAALDADDPLAIARSVWYAAHVLRAVGRADDALERLADAARLIEPRVADGGHAWAEMLADLHLCTALTHARNHDERAWHHLERAHDVIHGALPADYVGAHTRVSRSLLEVYAVMCAVDLGDSDEAQRRAYGLDPATIPSTERRARHFVELARSADLEGSREAVLHLLTKAQDVSPEVVTYSPAARGMIDRLIRDGGATIRADAEALAQRVGFSGF